MAMVLHGGTTATGNFNVTAALATVTFFAIIIAGARAHGFVQHWKNLVPHGLPLPVTIMVIAEEPAIQSASIRALPSPAR